ncbi:unnamed protein product [Notodromas monacha]|uniref:Uncharacterized protein n=1 Tax=Notodromas monacha TaxID=399045 RepID=A0A7R9BYK5_9CRUS|nr:unnamed protein product [Notodromas monacha]CAG0922510.1 unnamed protein product [Notodromas monacha]
MTLDTIFDGRSERVLPSSITDSNVRKGPSGSKFFEYMYVAHVEPASETESSCHRADESSSLDELWKLQPFRS